MPHLHCPPEFQSRHEQNMAYLKDAQPRIFALLEKYSCKSQIGTTDDKKINIFREGAPLYKNSIEDAGIIAESYVKKPVRLLMGKPAGQRTFEDVSNGKEHWLTQPYDDKPEDFHFGRYAAKFNDELFSAHIEPSEKFTGNSYYLVVYGIGTGLQIRTLLEGLKPKHIILADSDLDGLYMTTFFLDWQELTEYMKSADVNFQVTIAKTATELHEGVKGCLVTTSLMGLDGLAAYIDNDLPILRQAYYKLMDPKSANIASFVGFITDEYNMMKNSFRNLRSGRKKILTQCTKKCDKPVLIVGSGPSLEDNVHLLREHQNKFVIISSGSNLKVLLKNGIVPDVHCNLERASSILVRHEELIEEGLDLSQIYAVMTTTIWPGVDKFFKDTVYFIRPALSPLGVFCDSLDQVLYGEGPQVTNTAFAFARRLAAKEIYLLGVDLGTSDPDRPRAGEAWKGIRPRSLTIPVRGNKGKTVYTDMQLLQQRETLQAQIKKLNEVGGRCVNLGHGAKVHGAMTGELSKIQLSIIENKKSFIDNLFEQFPTYDRQRFETNWNSSVVRESVARFINKFLSHLSKPGWSFQMMKEIEDLCQYGNKPMREQYAPRLLRGSLLRMLMHTNSSIQRIPTDEEKVRTIEIAKRTLEEHIRRIEREVYSLADELESEDESLLEINN